MDNPLVPKHLSEAHISPPVWGILETPPTPGPHPGVVLLHGSSGWQTAYPQIAKILADSGLVALAIDYYVETGSYSQADELKLWPVWQATVRNAVAYLQANPSVSGRPIGLVGYSLGAYLAVSVASSIPAVTVVVEFFGGGSEVRETLEQ